MAEPKRVPMAAFLVRVTLYDDDVEPTEGTGPRGTGNQRAPIPAAEAVAEACRNGISNRWHLDWDVAAQRVDE